ADTYALAVSISHLSSALSFHCYSDHRALHSFPTRRSSDLFLTTLKRSLDEGNVSEADIDRACRRILEAKYKLGLFDDPFRYCDRSEERRVGKECRSRWSPCY